MGPAKPQFGVTNRLRHYCARDERSAGTFEILEGGKSKTHACPFGGVRVPRPIARFSPQNFPISLFRIVAPAWNRHAPSSASTGLAPDLDQSGAQMLQAKESGEEVGS